MRLLLMAAALLAAAPAMALRISDHPTNRNLRLVTCDNGSKTYLQADSRLMEKARAYCRENVRQPQAASPRSEPAAPARVQCSASTLPVEDEWKPGRSIGTVSVPGTRPVTGNYDTRRHMGDHACVKVAHKGKNEYFQYRCGKEGKWTFVQRFWTRQDGCHEGSLSLR
jgi:hypothetical protein